MLLVYEVFKGDSDKVNFMFSLTNCPAGDGVLSQLNDSETK